MTFDAHWWEQHYQEAAARPPGESSALLVAEAAALAPGTALDAGCGTGADAVWLAARGWDVTAVDVSPTAVQRARESAAEQAADVRQRITWLVADLTAWAPPQRYDLVVSQYVHPDQPFADFVDRLAGAVAPGGTLLVVGHDHRDAHSAAHAPADASIEAGGVVRSLDPGEWDVEAAGVRTRAAAHGASQLTDVVVRARRRPAG